MTATAPARPVGAPSLDGAHVSFGRLIRSEWIKLRSLRSTIWCFAILVVITIAFAALPALAISADGRSVSGPEANITLVQLGTANVMLTSLVVAVLGVLIISGEFGTGMIRSTFAADPGRTAVLLAKASVLAASTFVVSIVSTWIGVLLAAPLLANNGIHAAIGDPSVFMPILGASVYVTMVALLAFTIGLLVRASAGGITIALCMLLVLPTVVSIIGNVTHSQVIQNIVAILPSSAGALLYQYGTSLQPQSTGGALVLNGWGGFLVFLAWIVVVGVLAFVSARRRDV